MFPCHEMRHQRGRVLHRDQGNNIKWCHGVYVIRIYRTDECSKGEGQNDVEQNLQDDNSLQNSAWILQIFLLIQHYHIIYSIINESLVFGEQYPSMSSIQRHVVCVPVLFNCTHSRRRQVVSIYRYTYV